MRVKVLSAAAVATTLAQSTSAVLQPSDSKLQARQSINFDLVDSTPDPTVQPNDTSNFNPAAAIASVIAEVKAGNPLSERKRALEARDIIVSTYPGYTANTPLGNVAINAPLDCNQKDTYMGVKLFTDTAFDTALCAAACSAQTEYNVAHPPSDRPAQTCQFYNTYALYKNDVYEGQYCSLYNQTWAASYATNDGQWRGEDHYTIRSSYIASNAANPGICAQIVAPNPASPVPEDPTKLLSSPEDLEFCVSYIGYTPPVETTRIAATISTVTRTTTTNLATSTPPAVTLTETVVAPGETTVVAATETTVTTVLVPAPLKKRAPTVATPAVVLGWSPQQISAACSKVATFVSTTTLTTATETVYTATETGTTTQLVIAPTPTITVATTSPLIRTIGVTSTTLVTVTSTAAPISPQCAGRSLRLCCLNIAPWSSNSAVWGGICGYTPTNPSELIGARCITRPASGQCPAGTSQACCKGSIPGQCALGTQCARV